MPAAWSPRVRTISVTSSPSRAGGRTLRRSAGLGWVGASPCQPVRHVARGVEPFVTRARGRARRGRRSCPQDGPGSCPLIPSRMVARSRVPRLVSSRSVTNGRPAPRHQLVSSRSVTNGRPAPRHQLVPSRSVTNGGPAPCPRLVPGRSVTNGRPAPRHQLVSSRSVTNGRPAPRHQLVPIVPSRMVARRRVPGSCPVVPSRMVARSRVPGSCPVVPSRMAARHHVTGSCPVVPSRLTRRAAWVPSGSGGRNTRPGPRPGVGVSVLGAAKRMVQPRAWSRGACADRAAACAVRAAMTDDLVVMARSVVVRRCEVPVLPLTVVGPTSGPHDLHTGPHDLHTRAAQDRAVAAGASRPRGCDRPDGRIRGGSANVAGRARIARDRTAERPSRPPGRRLSAGRGPRRPGTGRARGTWAGSARPRPRIHAEGPARRRRGPRGWPRPRPSDGRR